MEQNPSTTSLTRQIPFGKDVYHASRVPELVNNKLYSSEHPDIAGLETNNSDALLGPGIYAANEKSGKRYLENRAKIHPEASLYKINIGGKNMFDLRLLLSLQSNKTGTISKLLRMIRSSNEKVSQYGLIIRNQLIQTTQAFIKFLHAIKTSQDRGQYDWVDEIISKNETELENSQNPGIDFTIPYLGTSHEDRLYGMNHEALFLFGKFLSTQGLDGLIGMESPDWNNDGKNPNLNTQAYVLFDPKGEGISAQRVE